MRRFSVFYLDMRKPETRGQLYEVWERLEADNLLDSLFYDGSVSNWPDFACEILRPGSLPFVVLADNEPAAFSWLNQIASRSARTHFAIFRKFHGRNIHSMIGRQLYSYILTRKDKEGYLFDCLYGVTPQNNRLAVKAAGRCGWKICGMIPNACYLAKENCSVPGIISCATREILDLQKDADVIWEG